MAGAEDIVAVSIPFAAGVAITAALPLGWPCLYWVAAAGCIAQGVFLYLLCRNRRNGSAAFPLFFSAGVFCCSTALISGTGDDTVWKPAVLAMDGLVSLIGNSLSDDLASSLVTALLTGRRDGLDNGTVQAFRNSGAAHILALSGLHLGVIYGLFRRILTPLGHSPAATVGKAVLTVSACGFYTVMTGASPSIVRAFLFIVTREISGLCPGRRRTRSAALCTALTVQLLFNPRIILSLGFQLSYLSMAGIFILFPVLDSWYPAGDAHGPLRKIWSSAALSISCQLFTAPLVWIRFRTFPVFFLLTNLLALPLTEVLIVCSVLHLALCSFGLHPGITERLVEWLARALAFSLETISSMSPKGL